MSGSAAPRSSFWLAMRILPPDPRRAMFSVYRFCRAVDDIADEPEFASVDIRMSALSRWREDVGAMFRDKAPRELDDLAWAASRYGLRQEDFEAVIDGVSMDALQSIRAPDWPTLDLYCDRVASAVGRLSVRIFGFPSHAGDPLAFHLGRALQLTNILRDVEEDAALGRLYIPREALSSASIATNDPLEVAAHPRLPLASAEIGKRARGHFTQADAILDKATRLQARAPRLMSVAYQSILDKMESRGFARTGGRPSPSRLRVLGALLHYGVL